ncbi:MAG TPA: site-2 protease family protein [Telluria sp.]|jgi:Zn-dependent protease
MTTPEIIQTIAIYAIPVLFAISLHEAAHGYVARYFGDPTAANEGRLSLNPIRHIDPFGTILLPLALQLMQIVPIGYAKPVPVDFNRLRNPKKQMAFVALAGPMANFAMGLGWALFGILITKFGMQEPFFYGMVKAGIGVNAAMCVFNLIPIPPLDGGRVMTSLLPMPLAVRFARIERYSLFVFIGLIALMQFRMLDGVLLAGMRVVVSLFALILSPLTLLLN